MHLLHSTTNKLGRRNAQVKTYCELDSNINSFVYTTLLESVECQICIRAYTYAKSGSETFHHVNHLLVERAEPGTRISAAVECGYHTAPNGGYGFTDNIGSVTCPSCKRLYELQERNMPVVPIDALLSSNRIKALGKVNATDVLAVMHDSGVSETHKRYVMNGLYNRAHSAQAEEMTIKQLVDTPGWKVIYGEINVPSRGFTGQIDSGVELFWVEPLGKVAARLGGEEYLIRRNTTVRVWRRDEVECVPKKERCLVTYYNTGADGCATGTRCSFDEGHTLPHRYEVAEEVHVDGVKTMSLEDFYNSKELYRGRTIQIRHVAHGGPTKGVFTDIWHTLRSSYGQSRNTYTLVVDGMLYSETGSHMVYILPENRGCEYPFQDGKGGCEMGFGHKGNGHCRRVD